MFNLESTHIKTDRKLLVGTDITIDGVAYVEIFTPDLGQLCIPRYSVTTPVLVCSKCFKPVLRRINKKTGKEFAVCPDNSRHLYEMFYAASHAIDKYNRATRKAFSKKAIAALQDWKRQVEKRMQDQDTEDKSNKDKHKKDCPT